MSPRISHQEQVEQALHKALKRTCPSPHMLGEYQLNLLSSAEEVVVHEHVQTCPHCRRELAMLDGFLSEPDNVAESDGLLEVVVEWGRNLMQRPGLAPAGVRGVASRVQTFTAGHLWLAITVEGAENGRKKLLALVTREDGYPLEHGSAWLSQENRLAMGGKIDPYGNLVIDGLEPGEYDLGIQCDGTRVWIRGVSV